MRSVFVPKHPSLFLSTLLLLLLFSASCSMKENGDKYVSEANDLIEADKYQEGIVVLRRIAGTELKEREQKEVYSLFGTAYNGLDQYDSSIYYHKKALELDPSYQQEWVHLGITYRLLEKYDSTEYCYKKAMALDPNDPELNASLGALYVVKEEYKKGIDYLLKAIELKPTLASAHSNLAIAFAITGDFAGAETEYKACEKLNYKKLQVLREKMDEIKGQGE